MKIEKDKDGNITYVKDDDGYEEINEYKNGKLIYSKITYSNGIVEVEKYNYKDDEVG